VDLLEALLLAACFAVIEIPVSSFQIPHFEVTIESLIHVLIRNDPRKENRIFIRCFILKTFRFSFMLNDLEYRTSPCGDDNKNTYFRYYIKMAPLSGTGV